MNNKIKNIDSYYESRTRKNRYGDSCASCNKTIEPKNDCFRIALGYNAYGCMEYNTLCVKCQKRIKKAQKPKPNYKKAYSILMEYFNYIPEESRELVSQKLDKINL